MLKAIYYKEWIKTRVFAIVSVIVSLGITGYSILRIARVVRMQGIEHMWEILLSRDVIFIEPMRYLPLALGIMLAVVQFVPEMMQKRLKLTLHLPYPRQRMIAQMMIYGAVMLGLLYGLQYAVLSIYMQGILAPELSGRILLTALPWYVCGLNVYFMAAWICLEPTWKRRFINALITVGVVRIYFLSSVPEAYNCFLPLLILFTACTMLFPLLSVQRFKEGCQD